MPLPDAIELFERSAVCLGHTALCCSGGGALSMYHMGVVKALLENDCMPIVVSGTSGGAIVAGVLACHTDDEMLRDIIQDDIAERYPERWFPPLEQQLLSYLKTGVLVSHDGFADCCRAYFGDTTFQVACPPLHTSLGHAACPPLLTPTLATRPFRRPTSEPDASPISISRWGRGRGPRHEGPSSSIT